MELRWVIEVDSIQCCHCRSCLTVWLTSTMTVNASKVDMLSLAISFTCRLSVLGKGHLKISINSLVFTPASVHWRTGSVMFVIFPIKVPAITPVIVLLLSVHVLAAIVVIDILTGFCLCLMARGTPFSSHIERSSALLWIEALSKISTEWGSGYAEQWGRTRSWTNSKKQLCCNRALENNPIKVALCKCQQNISPFWPLIWTCRVTN